MRSSLVGRLVQLLLAAVLLYVSAVGVAVWWAARSSEGAVPAQALIVLGAAQYDGRPSPVFQARLDHTAKLYRQGVAPVVVVTGGQQAGDRVTEARAAFDELVRQGVPADAIRWEVHARNTYESLAASSRFLREEGITEVVLVSDAFHSFRLQAVAEEVGLQAYVSPTRTSPLTGRAELRLLLRETVAVSVGELVGYRRAHRLGALLDGGTAP